jgi:hypothetical protein
MSRSTGSRVSLSLAHRLRADQVHFARQVPSVPLVRRMNLADLVAIRSSANPRPSWCALFTKAFSFVSEAWPAIRQTYLAFPTPHLYEHPESIASVTIHREFGTGQAVFAAPISQPHARSLIDLDAQLRCHKVKPIESLATYRRALRLARLPGPVRWLIWWSALNLQGSWKARFAGTFAVTSLSHLGVVSPHPQSPLTTTLSYGTVAADGQVEVYLAHDPRVLDSDSAAQVLLDLERVLNHEILTEVRYLQRLNAA